MHLRRTKRSNGRQRPRWKDGSHKSVKNKDATESRSNEIALEPSPQIEPLVMVPQLLKRSYEQNVSERHHIAVTRPHSQTGADTRIEEFAVIVEVRLALRSYGRAIKLRFSQINSY